MTTTANRSNIRRRLGRGLGSLISAPVKVELPADEARSGTSAHPVNAPPAGIPAQPIAQELRSGAMPETAMEGLHNLAIAAIVPNPRQPRQHLDEAALRALADSIRISGVMQPIVVRPVVGASPDEGGRFELIAGERRWRAAQTVGLARIPALVREVDDRAAAEFLLVENLQREDLNPIERAEAFARLLREFNLTHAEIAERVGLERSSVSNHLRLLELDEASLLAVREGKLSMGHAKALLAIANLKQRERLAVETLRNDWPVRELERRAREAAGDPTETHNATTSVSAQHPLANHLTDLQKRLAAHLGTKVGIRPGRAKGSGKLVINFYSIDQFEGLLRRMDFEMDE